MPTRRKIGFIIFMVLLGGAIGSLLGKLIGLLMPDGVAKDFFIEKGTWALGPVTLDAAVLKLTLGLSFDLNVIGLIGIGVAIYLLRWVLN